MSDENRRTMSVPKAPTPNVVPVPTILELASTLRGVATHVADLHEKHRVLAVDVAEIKGHVIRTSAQSTMPSQHDLDIQAELAKEKAAREALALELRQNTKVTAETLAAAKSIFKHPVVITLLMALAAFVTSWLEKHT